MGWWRVLVETWWWVLCGVALGAVAARVLLQRPVLPVETHPAFGALRAELAAAQAEVVRVREESADLMRDRRSIIDERDALARQVHDLEGELRQARRRIRGDEAEPV